VIFAARQVGRETATSNAPFGRRRARERVESDYSVEAGADCESAPSAPQAGGARDSGTCLKATNSAQARVAYGSLRSGRYGWRPASSQDKASSSTPDAAPCPHSMRRVTTRSARLALVAVWRSVFIDGLTTASVNSPTWDAGARPFGSAIPAGTSASRLGNPTNGTCTRYLSCTK
jgi:hypothetical protein